MCDLSDLEICKKIATIEGLKTYIDVDTGNGFLNLHHPASDMVDAYNPLTDDALITNLIFKYEVCINHYSGVVYIDSDYTDRPPIAQVGFDDLEGMKKAVCLAIIEANSNV